ncbi:O-methyltransferase [Salinifilum ghardaiensis]
MDQRVRAVIDEVVARSEEHDSAEADRLRRWRVLEEPAGRFLGVLVRAANLREVVEIGTSRGVSTLWLGEAVRTTGGRVVSIDVDADAQQHAGRSLARAGLSALVALEEADGGEYLAALPDASVDLLFLDAERTEYTGWWPHQLRVLRPGGVLVVDNATSHPDEIAPLAAELERSSELTTTTLGIGKGELVAVRHR